jgi:SAM-dependent methyltransferase
MARVFTKSDSNDKPRLDREVVLDFFKQRSNKSEILGSIQAVIYQDKNPEIALSRDKVEKEKLIPLIEPRSYQKVLDLGCGTGRWIDAIYHDSMRYFGIDFCEDLISIARKNHHNKKNVDFIVSSIDCLDLKGEDSFDLILCFGVLIYLNDDELKRSLSLISDLASKKSTIMFREPIAKNERLSIINHYSNDMDQIYNAIYRTENELLLMFEEVFFEKGFVLEGKGNMYEDNSLNNRQETIQCWFKLKRDL